MEVELGRRFPCRREVQGFPEGYRRSQQSARVDEAKAGCCDRGRKVRADHGVEGDRGSGFGRGYVERKVREGVGEAYDDQKIGGKDQRSHY